MGNKPSKFVHPPYGADPFKGEDQVDDLQEVEMIPVGSCDDCDMNIYAHDEGNLCSTCAWYRRTVE